MNRPPHIVIILADDHRAEFLGGAGHPIVRTPHLDALAARGTRFDNAFCTSAACTPSRVCYQLGQWERQHGVNFGSDSSVSPEAWARSYPALLKEAGYFTAYVGKNHSPVGEGGYASGLFERFFDYWYANHNHTGFYPKAHHPIFRNARADTQAEIFAEGVDNLFEPDPAFHDGALVPLGRWDGRQPLLLSLNFNMPHRYGTGTMELRDQDDPLYREAYRDQWDDIPLPETYVPYADEPRDPKIPRDVYSRQQIASYDYTHTPDAYREHYVRYCQCVTGIDRVVGKVVEHLRRIGELDNTLIIYSADHGIQAGEFGLGGKVILYDPSLRIPMIVASPRDDAISGQVRHEMVVPQDVTSTILAHAGVEPPSCMQGSDLTPLLAGHDAPWRDELFVENLMTIQAYPRIEALRTQDYKYIRYFPRHEANPDAPDWTARQERYIETLDNSRRGEKPSHEELFHLASDPHEKVNLVDDQAHAAMLARLRARIDAQLDEARGERPLTPADRA